MESKPSTGLTSKLHAKDISSISLIFRNLLILEDDLRQQYKRNLVMKLGYQCFLYSLTGILIYLIFFSQYGTGIYIRLLELFISITLILFRFSGEEYLNKNLQFKIFLRNSNSVLKDYNLQLVIITKTYSQMKGKTNSKRLQLIFKTLMVLFIIFESIIDRLLKSLLLLKYKHQDISTKEKVSYLEYKLTYWKIMLQTSFLLNDNQLRKLTELESKSNIIDYDNFCNTYDVKLILDPNRFKVSTINTWQKYRLEFWNRERIRRLNRLDELYKK